MTSRSVKRLRRKFIVLATLTYFLVMAFMGVLINVANTWVTQQQIYQVLDYLSENDGYFSIYEDDTVSSAEITFSEIEASENADASETFSDTSSGSVEDTLPPDPTAGHDEQYPTESTPSDYEEEDIDLLENFSPEYRYSTRYFSMIYESDRSTVSEVRLGHSSLSMEEASIMAQRALSHRRLGYGHTGYYFWKTSELEDGRYIVVFLNCKTQVNANKQIFDLTLLIASFGLVITTILVYRFSDRIIQPEIENLKRQKQFITNASHELKTPLAVIRANTEIEEMMNGENEWTQSTMRQVDRLNGLIQNLVQITRAQEREDRSVMTSIDVSAGVRETVEPFSSLAQQEKKELKLNIQPNIMMTADESKIRQLTSLLIDNAFKYCDEEGSVSVRLESLKKGKQVRLVISNSYRDGANVDYSRFFERFYREDASHNVDKGGYGIGLSIAESICRQYGGSITASWKDGIISFTCLLTA